MPSTRIRTRIVWMVLSRYLSAVFTCFLGLSFSLSSLSCSKTDTKYSSSVYVYMFSNFLGMRRAVGMFIFYASSNKENAFTLIQSIDLSRNLSSMNFYFLRIIFARSSISPKRAPVADLVNCPILRSVSL